MSSTHSMYKLLTGCGGGGGFFGFLIAGIAAHDSPGEIAGESMLGGFGGLVVTALLCGLHYWCQNSSCADNAQQAAAAPQVVAVNLPNDLEAQLMGNGGGVEGAVPPPAQIAAGSFSGQSFKLGGTVG